MQLTDQPAMLEAEQKILLQFSDVMSQPIQKEFIEISDADLIAALKQLPPQHADRDVLETALYGCIAHLEVHARVMGQTMDAELERV